MHFISTDFINRVYEWFLLLFSDDKNSKLEWEMEFLWMNVEGLKMYFFLGFKTNWQNILRAKSKFSVKKKNMSLQNHFNIKCTFTFTLHSYENVFFKNIWISQFPLSEWLIDRFVLDMFTLHNNRKWNISACIWIYMSDSTEEFWDEWEGRWKALIQLSTVSLSYGKFEILFPLHNRFFCVWFLGRF